MDYIDFTQLHPIGKAVVRVKESVISFPKNAREFFKTIGNYVATTVKKTEQITREVISALINGDFYTRLSFLVMGSGHLLRKQYGKGLLFLLTQIGFCLYLWLFGKNFLAKLATLGTETQGKYFDEEQGIYIYTTGDNSMQILLFGVLTILLCVIFFCLYITNIRSAHRVQQLCEQGKRLSNFREEIHSLLDRRYHITLLSLPITLVTMFTILPLIFMVLISFTNFDRNHQPPGNLFTWVGLENFSAMFGGNEQLGYTFLNLLLWTFIWAFFATFTNYIFGIVLSLLINKKGIRFKKFWRTVFIITIAVPQFVTLMLMSQLLAEEGTVNVLLKELGWITESIPFLTQGTLAKITVVVVNMWVGIPYTMLIATGILLNIPADMYESARIDGAGPVRTFFKITMPYMLFVTAPYLITQFVNNINNFNVIYLLTQGGPLTLDFYKAGKTDLLVTWLYKQTVEEQNYNLAGVIGVVVFVITAVFSLIVYNSSSSTKKEEEFQ